jgi:hypothetical protein
MLAVEKDAIHRISGIDDHREPRGPVVSQEDRSILRELGHKIAEIGSLPVQEERKRMWSRLNRLEPGRPMIWLNDICLEIIMKDISTVRYQPQRLWEWVEIAGEVVESFS